MHQVRLYERIEQTLSEEISNGKYVPGDYLPTERDLMKRFNVGRPSIREALFSLSRRGLVEVGSGRPPRVIKPTFDIVIRELNLIVRQALREPDNLLHLIELRRVLEVGLARLAAKNATDEQIDTLRWKLEANHKAIGTFEPFWQSDIELHSSIAKITGNPLIPVVMNVVLSWLVKQRRVTIREPGIDEISYQQHCDIVEAIASHDVESAEANMDAHLNYIESNARKILNGEGEMAMATESGLNPFD